MIDQCLRLLCNPDDTERAFVKFDVDDSIVLLVNNYGGLSNLELGALTSKILEQLGMLGFGLLLTWAYAYTPFSESRWNVKPTRIFSGAFETSLNAPGFSISLCNLSKAAAASESQVVELLDLLDLKTSAVAWPATAPASVRRDGARQTDTNTLETQTKQSGQKGGDITSRINSRDSKASTNPMIVEPDLLDTMIRSGCKAAIAAEPNLTKWDMVMGDGDCGEAVHGVSQGKHHSKYIYIVLADGFVFKQSFAS